MKKLIFAVLLVLLLVPEGLFAQDKQFVRTFTGLRQEANPGYLMFLGDDRDQFATTVKGTGSGLIDIFNYRIAFDFLEIGGENVYLTTGLGFAVNKYRFRDNLIIEKQGDMVVAYTDTVATHDYVNTFFGYGKSKLVYGSVYVPVMLNIRSDKLLISAGAFYDYYLSGKLKRKYFDDGVKTIDKVPNSEFKDFNLNKGKIGFTFSITERKSNYGVAVTYMMTPFFMEGKGPALNELRLSIHNFTDIGALREMF